jgi:hypothetical protein
MPKETLIAIGAGVLSAVSATAFLTQAPGALIFVYLASLPLFMTGLALGPRAVTIAGAVGFMAAGLLGGGLSAGIFGLMQALPALLVVKQMLLQRSPLGSDGNVMGAALATEVHWYPSGDVLCWLTAMAGAILLVVALAALTAEQGLSTLVGTNLEQILQGIAPEMDPGRRVQAVELMAPLFPGAVGVSWLVMTLVNAILAQGLLVRLQWNIRPSPSYADLQLPHWMSWPLVGSAVLALLGSGEMEYTGRNLAMILAVPYFFLGLAVVHTWARRVAYTGMVLVAFYLVLVLSGWTALVVAGIGVFEQWKGLRHRAAGPNE